MKYLIAVAVLWSSATFGDTILFNVEPGHTQCQFSAARIGNHPQKLVSYWLDVDVCRPDGDTEKSGVCRLDVDFESMVFWIWDIRWCLRCSGDNRAWSEDSMTSPVCRDRIHKTDFPPVTLLGDDIELEDRLVNSRLKCRGKANQFQFTNRAGGITAGDLNAYCESYLIQNLSLDARPIKWKVGYDGVWFLNQNDEEWMYLYY